MCGRSYAICHEEANSAGTPHRLRCVRRTSLNLPDDVYDLMERAAASVGQSPTQFVREAVLLRCAVAAGGVSDEIRAMAADLSKR